MTMDGIYMSEETDHRTVEDCIIYGSPFFKWWQFWGSYQPDKFHYGTKVDGRGNNNVFSGNIFSNIHLQKGG